MVDMTQTIVPKSDQINADSLIGGPRTYTIERVTANEGSAEQPINIKFEGEPLVFRPCKSMRRVLVKIWGADASKYAGRSMTLYRDPKVKWGGMEVGGIRISHMTGLEKPETMALTETRSARKPYTVQPLKDVPGSQAKGTDLGEWARKFIASIGNVTSAQQLDGGIARVQANIDALAEQLPDAHSAVVKAIDEKRASFNAAEDDPFADAPADDIQPTGPDTSKVRRMIETAATKADLQAADDEFVKIRGALSDDEAAEIDDLVAQARSKVA